MKIDNREDKIEVHKDSSENINTTFENLGHEVNNFIPELTTKLIKDFRKNSPEKIYIQPFIRDGEKAFEVPLRETGFRAFTDSNEIFSIVISKVPGGYTKSPRSKNSVLLQYRLVLYFINECVEDYRINYKSQTTILPEIEVLGLKTDDKDILRIVND